MKAWGFLQGVESSSGSWVSVDWDAVDALSPRAAYDAIGALIPQVSRMVAVKRAELVWDLTCRQGYSREAAAGVLGISAQRVGQLRDRHQRVRDAERAGASQEQARGRRA